MPTRALYRTILLAVPALGLALDLVPAARAEGRRARLESLQAINERWEGADCALRVPFEFKKKNPEDGWYESVPYLAMDGEAEGIHNLRFRLKLRELAPLEGKMASRHLVAGTLFRCDGWKFRDEDSYDHAYLALRSVLGDVEGELWLWTGSGHPELKLVDEVERYMRLAIFDVRARRESLQAVAPSSSAPAAPVLAFGPARAAAPGPGTGVAYKPSLRVLAVAVDPPQVAAGGRVELVVHYAVEGLPPGAAFEVSETRQLSREGASLAETTETLARANGSFTSSQSAPIPPDAPRGVYRLEVAVRLAGVEATGAALFEVR